MGFDGLEVVEAQLMAGRGDESLVRRVRRAHQHLPESLRLLWPVRHKKSDLVETLLVEDDRALRAKDLQLQASLAAPGSAADLDRARHAIRQPEERSSNVERLALPAPAPVRAVRVRLVHLAEHLTGSADQGRDQAHGVNGEIIQ